MPSNDNHISLPPPPSSSPDVQGRAALLLVESLIHGLVERSVLTLEESIDIVETAMDVQADLANMSDDPGSPTWYAHSPLNRIVESLELNRTRKS